mmetsp:Transcript_20119/g.24809  ORF Transcript_20119/g.24809 Transcript_20119/m.24809 type:complete len:103 (+) Transcript_20119:609-917(+)
MQKNAEKTDAKIDQILATQDKAAAAAQRKHAKPVSKRTPGRPKATVNNESDSNQKSVAQKTVENVLNEDDDDDLCDDDNEDAEEGKQDNEDDDDDDQDSNPG